MRTVSRERIPPPILQKRRQACNPRDTRLLLVSCLLLIKAIAQASQQTQCNNARILLFDARDGRDLIRVFLDKQLPPLTLRLPTALSPRYSRPRQPSAYRHPLAAQEYALNAALCSCADSSRDVDCSNVIG